jgi:hypothetical protein
MPVFAPRAAGEPPATCTSRHRLARVRPRWRPNAAATTLALLASLLVLGLAFMTRTHPSTRTTPDGTAGSALSGLSTSPPADARPAATVPIDPSGPPDSAAGSAGLDATPAPDVPDTPTGTEPPADRAAQPARHHLDRGTASRPSTAAHRRATTQGKPAQHATTSHPSSSATPHRTPTGSSDRATDRATEQPTNRTSDRAESQSSEQDRDLPADDPTDHADRARAHTRAPSDDERAASSSNSSGRRRPRHDPDPSPREGHSLTTLLPNL